MGVTFETYCPPEYSGCPGANGTVTVVYLGIMTFTMSFPDGTNETASGVIGDATYIPILSGHSSPRAGMLIELTYGAHQTIDRVFLLVEGLHEGTPSNTVVATATVTTTVTTRASQASTTYAVPSSGCTSEAPALTTTTTITLGAQSTTTVTVTTTSTSYTQTVTVTSCYYSTPTVSSTVTTTVSP
jgi:hypothetical protein